MGDIQLVGFLLFQVVAGGGDAAAQSIQTAFDIDQIAGDGKQLVIAVLTGLGDLFQDIDLRQHLFADITYAQNGQGIGYTLGHRQGIVQAFQGGVG